MASYEVEVDRALRKEIRNLPGQVRQRVIRALQDLRQKPRPPESRPLETVKADIKLASGTELRRIRIESWRIVYLVEDEARLVSVLAVRKRPPYLHVGRGNGGEPADQRRGRAGPRRLSGGRGDDG